MILGAHQPDLFPYPGFFAKMARVDVFDIALHDQFQKKGYQRRVLMRGRWASIPVRGPTFGAMISEVHLAPGAVQTLSDLIVGRYRSARYFDDRWPVVSDWIAYAGHSDLLWRFNASLIHDVARWLGIETTLSTAEKPQGSKIDGLLDLCAQYPGVTAYLSGTGGRAYMGDDPEERFAEHGLTLLWNEWQSPTSDSILTLLFDDADPAAWFTQKEKL